MDGNSIKKFLFYNAAIDRVVYDLDWHHPFPSALGDDDASSFQRRPLSATSSAIVVPHRESDI